MTALFGLLAKSLRAARNAPRELQRHSRLKVFFIAGFCALLLFGLWGIFYAGFRFIDTLGGVGLVLVPRLFAMFFWGLGIMLVLSGLITSVSGLFRTAETDFLFTHPIPMTDLILYKYIGAIGLSSWAYFFVIVPFIGAYAWYEKGSLLLGGWALLFALPFVALHAGLGFLCCLTAARFLPRRRLPPLVLLLPLLAVCGWLWVQAPSPDAVAAANDESALVMNRILPGLRALSRPGWPSAWTAEGLVALSRGQWGRGVAMWLVLTAHALLVGLLVERAGCAWYYEALQRVAVFPRAARRRVRPWRALEWGLAWLPREVRALAVKDLRVFFRDPAQWTQGLLFFGLLAVYFYNMRLFRYHTLDPVWKTLIASLNVFSVSAVMCSYGSRFIYPQLSLEGQAYWILGMAPVSARRVLHVKFGMAWFILTAVGCGLMDLSTRRLAVDPSLRMAALGVAAVMALSIAGLSTGLGALFMDTRKASPAAIVGGFGGTLNLILCLEALFTTTLPMAILYHLHTTGRLYGASFGRFELLLGGWLVLVTVAHAWIPLRLGLRALERRAL